MQITLIRHGCTAGNLEHRYVGSTDEPLTEQAKEMLQSRQKNMKVPDILYVSPMKRCRETAQLLYPNTEQRIADGLRECSFGDFEYKNYIELDGNADYQAWLDSGGTLPFPGGESREAFAQRCCRAFEGCCLEAMEKGCDSIAFVVHGGTIMAVMERFARPQKSYFEWQVKNAEGFCGILHIHSAGDLYDQQHQLEEFDVNSIWISDAEKLSEEEE